MRGTRLFWLVLGVTLVFSGGLWHEMALGRGGGGGGRGGGGGGGGARMGGGGYSGGGARMGGSPSFSRPSAPAARPSAPASRPSAGVSRPSSPGVSRPVAGGAYPSTLPSRPAVGGGPSVGGGRPGVGNLPGGPQLGGRPSIGGSPSQLPARPGVVPGGGARPGQLPATRPGIAAGVGAGVGAGLGAAVGNRLPGAGQRPTQLPGMGGGNRWEQMQGNRQDFASNRRQDLQGRLENRQDFMNNWQQNRQDFVNDRRQDWQNQLNDRYPWHDGWHHGYWNDRWGNYWEHMWEQHPVWSAFGVTRWALNSVGYLFGTWGYVNPYYDVASPTTAIYDYSQPIVLYSEPATTEVAAAPAAAEAASLPPGVSEEALNQFEQARTAFAQGAYPQALELATAALKRMPGDATLHEFRALCLFALGNYREAAATLNAVLAVGPGWDWTTLVSLYPDSEVYTAQLRKLEAAISANPSSFDTRFVLAYHYLTAGHTDAAAQQLGYVVQAVPNDAVARQLYDMLTYKPSGEPTPQAPPATPAGPKLTADQLAGTWKAKGPSNSAFEMTLTKEGAFTWKYTRGNKQQLAQGVYAVDSNTLAMEPTTGGVMLANLTLRSPDQVDFKMIGAPESEAPLSFSR